MVRAAVAERAVRVQPIGDIREILAEWDRVLEGTGKSGKTREVYTDSVRLLADFLKQSGRPTEVTLVGREAIETFLADLARHGRKPATLSVRYRSLKRFFGWAADEASIGIENVMARISPVQVPEPTTPVLSDKEIEGLFETTARDRSFEGIRDGAILRLLLDTGIRRAELVGMTVDDLVEAGTTGRLMVFGKNRRERAVGVGAKTQSALLRYKRVRATRAKPGEKAAWIGLKGALTDSGMFQIVEGRGRAAGLKLKPHAMRHTWAAMHKIAGLNDSSLMALGGWRSPQIAQRYGRVAESEAAILAHKRLALGDRF